MLPATAFYVLGVTGALGAIRQGTVPWPIVGGLAVAFIVTLTAAVVANRSWNKMRGQAHLQTNRHDDPTQSTPTDRRRDPGLE